MNLETLKIIVCRDKNSEFPFLDAFILLKVMKFTHTCEHHTHMPV